MLPQTLQQMEWDGMVTRTVHPVIPPHVADEAWREPGLGILRRMDLGRGTGTNERRGVALRGEVAEAVN